MIARFGVGYDGIDTAKAASRGLICTNTPGVLDQSVAEHAMLLIAAAARRFAALPAQLEAAVWTPPVGAELAGKTLAIIGSGRIGRATARIASAGFGMTVVGYGRRVSDLPAGFSRTTTDFADAVRDANFVSVHLPTTQKREASSTAIGSRSCAPTRGSSTPHAAPSSTKPRSMMRWRRAARGRGPRRLRT